MEERARRELQEGGRAVEAVVRSLESVASRIAAVVGVADGVWGPLAQARGVGVVAEETVAARVVVEPAHEAWAAS